MSPRCALLSEVRISESEVRAGGDCADGVE